MHALESEKSVVSVGSNAVADTTSETKSAVEDMAGFDEIEYLVHFGDVDAAAVLTFTAKENTANSDSSPTPTTVGSGSITEDSGNLDNKLVRVVVKKSKITKRYHFLSITAADESYEIQSIITRRTSARAVPVTPDADEVLTVELYS